MDDFGEEVARTAENAVAMCASRKGGNLDYSAASLAVVEDALDEAAGWVGDMTPDQLTMLVQDFGCYVLEVARREFGGRYVWYQQRGQPVLVVGEPAFRVALLAWEKVRGRLGGDSGDNIPFFYRGFADRVRRAKPGDDALIV